MTIAERVESILANSSQARNSDKELYIIFMYKSGMNLTAEQIRTFREMPSLETIRRIRQKIQESGKYPANSKVQKERKHKAMVMEQTIPSSSIEQVEKRLNIRVLPWGKG